MRTTSALTFVIPFVTSALLAACGGASSSGGGGDGGGAGAGSGSGTPTKGGGVYVSSFDTGDGQGFGSVSASFYDNSTSTIDAGDAGSGGVTGCQRIEEGSCYLLLCPSSGGPIGSLPNPRTAGTIQVSTVSGTSVTLAPAADGTYPPESGNTPFWFPGDTVSVEAGGADVPAFSVSVPAPSSIEITAPIDGPSIDVDASVDLSFAWTGSGPSAGKVLVSLSSNDTAAGLTGVLGCELDPGAGQGTMPASLLGKLPPSNLAALSVSVVSRTSIDAGGYAVELVASAIATAQGHPATVNVVLE